MGQGMVQNLLEAGHEVNVIAHRNRRPIDELVALGAKEMTSLFDMASCCNIFILCLPSSQAVMSVCNVLFSRALPKTLIIDCTTNELITVKSWLDRQKQQDYDMLRHPLRVVNNNLEKLCWEL